MCRVAMLYIMSFGQGSCAVATSSRENRSNILRKFQMLLNMAAEGNVNVNNLVVQHPAFREMINSILTATNQEQSCLLLRLKSRSAIGASRHTILWATA